MLYSEMELLGESYPELMRTFNLQVRADNICEPRPRVPSPRTRSVLCGCCGGSSLECALG